MARLTIPDEDTFAEFTVTTSTSAFTISFSLFAKADLTVYVDGTALDQADFSFSGTLLDGGGYDGGTVTLNDAVDDVTVRIERNVAPTRTSQFAPAASTPVGSVDAALNRLTAIAQDQDRRLVSGEDVLSALEQIAQYVADGPEAASVVGKVSYAALALASGAGLVGWVNGMTGGVTRTVLARLRDRVSVLDFIPVAEHAAILARTSTTDLAAYVQAAEDALEAAGGGELFWPAGRYDLATVVNRKTGTVWTGHECFTGLATNIRCKVEGACTVSVASTEQNVGFIGLMFTGVPPSAGASHGAVKVDCPNVVFRTCQFFLFNDHAIWLASNSIHCRVDQCDSSSTCINYDRASRWGSLVVDGTDHLIFSSTFGNAQNYLTPGNAPGDINGQQSITSASLFNPAIYVLGSNNWFVGGSGENADISVVVHSGATDNRFTAFRFDQCWAHGLLDEGTRTIVNGCFVENVSLQADGYCSAIKLAGHGALVDMVSGKAVARFPDVSPTLKTPSYFIEDVSFGSAVNQRNMIGSNVQGPYLTSMFKFESFLGSSVRENPIVTRQTGATIDTTGTTDVEHVPVSAVTITSITGGFPGKVITIAAVTALSTIANNSAISTNTSADLPLVSGRVYTLRYATDGKWHVATGWRRASPTLTPAAVAANTSAEQTFTVAGLTTSDIVVVKPPGLTPGTGIVGTRVSGADTLAIAFANFTAGSLTPVSGTYTVTVVGPTA